MTQRHPALSASHVTGKDEMVTRMSQHGRFNRKKYETTWWIWYNMIKYQPFWVTLFFRQIHIAIVCFETAHPWTPECLCNQQMRTPTMWWENGKKVAFWKERKDFNLFTVTMVASTVSVSSLYPIVSVKKCMGTQQYEKHIKNIFLPMAHWQTEWFHVFSIWEQSQRHCLTGSPAPSSGCSSWKSAPTGWFEAFYSVPCAQISFERMI